MQELNAVFYIVILIMSVVIHEVSHGFAAYYFGDMTAKDQGRLTLNPLKHLDPFGSVILPALLVLSQTGFVFGWAKPVPYNPNNLSNKRWGTVVVASAGIISNFALALFFSIIIRVAPLLHITSEAFYSITAIIVLVNLVLAIFNLVPLPPLDGSKILFNLLPARFAHIERWLERYAIFVFLLLVLFLWNFISPVISILFRLLTGFAI
jgi:Zn-dependent protease